MKFRPGIFVVFEGLDATGKTTQLKRLKALKWDDPAPLFTSQPSGEDALGKKIYRLTETAGNEDMHPLTRQLLHLASHAQHYDKVLLPTLNETGVVMDRCWWSTIAYGYYGGGLRDMLGDDTFRLMAQAPAQGRLPDMVYLFDQPYAHDEHNTMEVMQGYGILAGAYNHTKVPAGTEDEVAQFIFDDLVSKTIVEA